MTDITLSNGETERIIKPNEANQNYILEVVGSNDVRIGHTEQYADDGTTLTAGQSHKISNLRGQPLFVAAFDGSSSIRVSEAAADVESQPERNVTVVDGDVNIASNIDVNQNQSRSSLTTFSVTTNGQFPSNSVPDGVEVAVIADPTNDAVTTLNGEIPMPAGSSIDLRISNTDLLSATFNGSGTDSISVIFEG